MAVARGHEVIARAKKKRLSPGGCLLSSSGNYDVLLDELDIVSYFDAIVSGAELPGKPEPDVFLEAANMIDVSPANCLVIEDAIAGVIGAKRAGMKCLAVTTTNPAPVLGEADLIVDSLARLCTKVAKATKVE